jgi:hypothetical protein
MVCAELVYSHVILVTQIYRPYCTFQVLLAITVSLLLFYSQLSAQYRIAKSPLYISMKEGYRDLNYMFWDKIYFTMNKADMLSFILWKKSLPQCMLQHRPANRFNHVWSMLAGHISHQLTKSMRPCRYAGESIFNKTEPQLEKNCHSANNLIYSVQLNVFG